MMAVREENRIKQTFLDMAPTKEDKIKCMHNNNNVNDLSYSGRIKQPIKNINEWAYSIKEQAIRLEKSFIKRVQRPAE